MNHQVVLISVALNGAVCISSFSVVFEYGVRLSPGIGESVSGGLINMLANGMGWAQMVIIQIIVDHISISYLNITMYFMYASLLINLILVMSIKESKE